MRRQKETKSNTIHILKDLAAIFLVMAERDKKVSTLMQSKKMKLARLKSESKCWQVYPNSTLGFFSRCSALKTSWGTCLLLLCLSI